jgi:deoxyribonuclease-4
MGSFRDRHENIGDGHLGYEGFRTLMAHPAFREVPFLLEVPGKDGKGPDATNIRRLKKLRQELGIDAPEMRRVARSRPPAKRVSPAKRAK